MTSWVRPSLTALKAQEWLVPPLVEEPRVVPDGCVGTEPWVSGVVPKCTAAATVPKPELE